jgi:hypothetical protein
MRIANIRNGLAFPHDDICYFQSQYAHHKRYGYFNDGAMPWSAVVHLVLGGVLIVVDATRKQKQMTDAQKFGVPTWCGVFNRALRFPCQPTCQWWTRDMEQVVRSDRHKKTKSAIRKLSYLYRNGDTEAAVIGRNVLLECHTGFTADDNNEGLVGLICLAGGSLIGRAQGGGVLAGSACKVGNYSEGGSCKQDYTAVAESAERVMCRFRADADVSCAARSCRNEGMTNGEETADYR